MPGDLLADTNLPTQTLAVPHLCPGPQSPGPGSRAPGPAAWRPGTRALARVWGPGPGARALEPGTRGTVLCPQAPGPGARGHLEPGAPCPESGVRTS